MRAINKKWLLFMGIPVAALFSLLAIRFVNISAKQGYSGYAEVPLPAKAEAAQNKETNIVRAEEAYTTRHRRVQNLEEKLVHLSFNKPVDSAYNFKEPAEVLKSQLKNVVAPPISDAGQLPPTKLPTNRLERKTSVTNQNFLSSRQPKASNLGLKESFNSYSSSAARSADQLATTVVKAMVFGDHSVTDGKLVLFRTADELVLKGHSFSKNTVFSARASVRSGHIEFAAHRFGEGSTGVKVNMTSRSELPEAGKASDALVNTASETRDLAVSEIAAQLPVGGGIVSRVGRSLFRRDVRHEVLLGDGQEVEFDITDVN